MTGDRVPGQSIAGQARRPGAPFVLRLRKHIEPQGRSASETVATICDGAIFGEALDGGLANTQVSIRNRFKPHGAGHILPARKPTHLPAHEIAHGQIGHGAWLRPGETVLVASVAATGLGKFRQIGERIGQGRVDFIGGLHLPCPIDDPRGGMSRPMLK